VYKTINNKYTHQSTSKLIQNEWITVNTKRNAKANKTRHADILSMHPVSVSNKYTPLANIQEFGNEDSSTHHKDSDGLETISRHTPHVTSTSLSQQSSDSNSKENRLLDCSINKYKIPQYIPTIINGKKLIK
jgi:hypothetical protein